ncbi:ankyrin repeat domain-containing protein [Chryseobacterium sp. SL1]|uniref:ankyrin repeat domain-containing protein n=1 Tax=Chryseobacterium sp. SL1 TaxID=2995159 RepID=UPI0022725C40|nr:SMI1/KNR4 family protein [Chryseobacterium sp. SL1]MCY1661561.1 SMI1/KNR4 family protein [Chryseobacterium sp. SL1]
MDLQETYPQINAFEIEQWEKKNNISIPLSYREYLLEYNAGYYLSDPTVFDVRKMGSFAVSNFFGLGDDINGLTYALRTYKDRYPKHYFPIARDVADNLILMGISGTKEGQIFFWYHEMEQDTGKKPFEKNIFKTSKTLKDFISSLYTPEEISYGELVDIFDGNEEGIKKLLDSDWDIDTPCEFNQTLVQRAALGNRTWLVKELIERGAKLNGAIEQSMTLNSFESMELLLAGGADTEETDKYGYTFLHRAVMGNRPKAVELLLKYGADKNAKNEFGDTPLETALFKKQKGLDMDEIIKLLQSS